MDNKHNVRQSSRSHRLGDPLEIARNKSDACGEQARTQNSCDFSALDELLIPSDTSSRVPQTLKHLCVRFTTALGPQHSQGEVRMFGKIFAASKLSCERSEDCRTAVKTTMEREGVRDEQFSGVPQTPITVRSRNPRPTFIVSTFANTSNFTFILSTFA